VAETQLESASKYGVSVVTLSDKDYPQYLREIFAPPPLLYVKGCREVLKRHAVSVVGTRNPTSYGKNSATTITRELVEHNLVIVSGLARGIDTFAHECCIQSQGVTIAVLGSGLDTIYPPVNRDLASKICEKGVLISEFPMGTPPEAFNFPRRNRIISGLSAAVIVVEAGLRSGSLITAQFALQQGRDIFAVPGPITSLMSVGTFNLIREGAVPARSGHEIAESLKVILSPVVQCAFTALPVFNPGLLLESEWKIFQQLSDVPVRIDDLSVMLGIEIADLYPVLLNLEIKGLIHQGSGQSFTKI
jgi:DNA processing protein